MTQTGFDFSVGHLSEWELDDDERTMRAIRHASAYYRRGYAIRSITQDPDDVTMATIITESARIDDDDSNAILNIVCALLGWAG
jgi:hypothetical protein